MVQAEPWDLMDMEPDEGLASAEERDRLAKTDLTVLYDHQIFDSQRFGGISRYYTEMIHTLHGIAGVNPRVGIRFSFNDHLDNPTFSHLFASPDNLFLGLDRPLNNLYHHGFAGYRPNRWLGYLINNRKLSIASLREGCEVFHPTYYDPYFLPHLGNVPFVLTIYDMIHELFLNRPESEQLIANKRKLAHAADRVIAISESTKKDAVEMMGIPAEKVAVIHLASSLVPPVEPSPVPGLPSGYILFVGKRDLYKNFSFLIKASKPLFDRYPGLKLVCAGGGPFTPFEHDEMVRHGVRGQMLQIDVDDDILSKLYANALAFVFPTRYEGFGIPVLEAMSCGCPVVATNTSSLPEVGGDAAMYFKVDDQGTFLEAMMSVLDDREVREKCRSKGLQRARSFSWDRVAKETLAVYERLI